MEKRKREKTTGKLAKEAKITIQLGRKKFVIDGITEFTVDKSLDFPTDLLTNFKYTLYSLTITAKGVQKTSQYFKDVQKAKEFGKNKKNG